MMTTKNLVNTIVGGIQEQKGLRIVTADLTKIPNTICKYLIICEGNSNTHVNSIALKTKDYVREHAKEKPIAMEGFENCEWIIADYGDIMLHIMQREPRAFYDLEHLWADAKLTEIADL
ncbi:MAG: ribosome silencing factor [Paludibacteraceae bacterium]|nr:ribosome silencing factor [Paludibacteraceae bacterium]HOH96369.1 ribosome silencing factor [Candidatus Enterocola sp.]HPG54844.1 ribosome silencing factor [Candidatus Enterocola sp.]